MRKVVLGLMAAGAVAMASTVAMAGPDYSKLGPPSNPQPTTETYGACDALWSAYKDNPANLPGDNSGPSQAEGSPVVTALFRQTLTYCFQDGWTPAP